MGDENEFPTVILNPIQSGSSNDFVRTIILSERTKVGRAVQNRVLPAVDNAIFDSKVLSRSHAEIWESKGKVYIKDTKSSNGTWLNDQRLCDSSQESDPFELKDGDKLRLGVDIRDDRTVSHSCVIVEVSIEYPNSALEAEVRKITFTPLSILKDSPKDFVLSEMQKLQEEYTNLHEDFEVLAKHVNDANIAEAEMETKIADMSKIMGTCIARMESQGRDHDHVDKLLTRIEGLELQLDFYKRKSMEGDHPVDLAKINEINDILQEKHALSTSMKRALSEKLQLHKDLQKAKMDLTSLQNVNKEQKLQSTQKLMEQGAVLDEVQEKYQNSVADYNALASTLEEKDSRLEKEKESHTQQLQQLEKDHETKINDLIATLNATQEAEQTAQKKVEEAEKKWQEELQSSKNTVKQLEEEKGSLSLKFNALESNTSALKRDNENLLKQLAETKKELDKAKEAVDTANKKMETSIETLKREQDGLKDMESDLRSERTKVKERDNQIKSQKKKIAALEAEAAKASSTNKQLQHSEKNFSPMKHFILGLCVSGVLVVLATAMQPTIIQDIANAFA